MENTRGDWRRFIPHWLGITVLIVGILATAAPAVILVNGLWTLPVVVAWALVYGYARNAGGRWPWWVMGQWVSLWSVFSLTLWADFSGWAMLFAPVAATLMLVVWMAGVGMVVAQRRFWHTKLLDDDLQAPRPAESATENSLAH